MHTLATPRGDHFSSTSTLTMAALSAVFFGGSSSAPPVDAEYAQYIEELTSFGLERLKREPQRLHDARERLNSDLHQLSVREYRSFVANADATQATSEGLAAVRERLDSLESHLPALVEACSNVEERASAIREERRAVNLVLEHHGTLLELLEIPQLLETCVQNGYYDEALELVQHAHRLRTRFGHVSVVRSITQDVAAHCDRMVSQLIRLLRTDIKLPMCLRVTGFLRRTDYFSDAQLRLVFLDAREAVLSSQLAAIPTSDPAAHLKRHMDCSRDHLFDIITQYRAIFADAAGRDPVLHAWVLRQTHSFIDTLTAQLARVREGAALAALLTQAMYFGLSLGRVGADLRVFIVAPFEEAIFRVTTSILAEGLGRFTNELPTAPRATCTSAQGKGESVLLDSPPLGLLYNTFMAATNELRQVAPLSLIERLADAYRQTLADAAAAIVENKRDDHMELFTTVLAPAAVRAFASVYASHASMVTERIAVQQICAQFSA